MSAERNPFLARVRQAVAEGNRAGVIPALPARGGVGYQGAGPDLVARFQAELAAAGGHTHLVPDRAAAVARVLDLVRSLGARRALVESGQPFASLDLSGALRGVGVEVRAAEGLRTEQTREESFAADVGVSGVDYLVAETGSLALLSRPERPRSVSLLPPAHVAVAWRSQLLPDLFDLFAAVEQAGVQGLPACLSLITGPSKTGDIELRLVTGVHGPGAVDVVLIDEDV